MKKLTIAFFVVLGVVICVGLGVLIWWLVRAKSLYETILLEGKIGDITSTAAFTRIQGNGDMFWWFYPSLAASPTSKPIIIWLQGVTGVSTSFLANFGMFGPYDINLNRRDDSWVNDYNLLFIDAPLGTGFSTSNSDEPNFPELSTNVDHLVQTIQSFYDIHDEYRNSPVYICSQGDGAQLALALTTKLTEKAINTNNLKGIILGNPIISPALVLDKLGFYLEELGYIDGNGRIVVENLASQTNSLVQTESFQEAFNLFTSLGYFVNENAGAVAVNLAHIVEKLTRTSSVNDYFGELAYLKSAFRTDVNINNFMDNVVGPALGIPDTVKYDAQREGAIRSFRNTYMKPIVDKVEYILENTELTVNIYNGNLDAISNTPGQLEWINNLTWSGQTEFLNSPRTTLVYNRLIEGYFRESHKLRFYWINVAGQSVPLDNPIATRRVLNRITN